jgi:hypothetical protein
LHQHSAKGHEQGHNTNLKDGWNAFNHNLNSLLQVFTFQPCILSFEISELDLQALALRRGNSALTGKIHPSGDDLAAPPGLESCVKPELMGLQLCHDGTHPETMITDFRRLLDTKHDAMHQVAIYSGRKEFIKYKHRNMTYISDEQWHTMELCNFHGIMVEVDGLEGEHILQLYRCTRSQSWHGGDRGNDGVWVKHPLPRSYCTLNLRPLGQQQLLLKIKRHNNDAAFVDYWFALALTAIPEQSVDLDPISKLVQLRT